MYLSPCFYPVDFVNCWEQPDITPEAEIPAGVISHTSQNLMKKNMGTETKGPSPCFIVSQLKINPLLCRGREDLQIKANSRDKIKVGLQNHK